MAYQRAGHQTGTRVVLALSRLPNLETFVKSICSPQLFLPKYSRWLQCSVSNQMFGRDQAAAQSSWVFKEQNAEHVRGCRQNRGERRLPALTGCFSQGGKYTTLPLSEHSFFNLRWKKRCQLTEQSK